MVNSPDVGELPDKRIVSATEEINQISDDIREAKEAGSSDHADAAPLASKPTDSVPRNTDPIPTSGAQTRAKHP